MESDVTPDGSDVDGGAALPVDLSTLLQDDARLASVGKQGHDNNPFQPEASATLPVAANSRAAPSSDSTKSATGYRTESLRLFVGTWNMCAAQLFCLRFCWLFHAFRIFLHIYF